MHASDVARGADVAMEVASTLGLSVANAKAIAGELRSDLFTPPRARRARAERRRTFLCAGSVAKGGARRADVRRQQASEEGSATTSQRR